MLQTAIIHHDSAPSHRATQTTETIKDSALNLYTTPYSPDLAPFDLFSISIDQECLRGKRFGDVADLPNVVQQAIDEIPVNSYR